MQYDVAIVGGGIIGCAIARELSRFSLETILLEAQPDVGSGTTKANGGLVHSGYDPAPGTVKAQVNATGNRLYRQWSKELGFSFNQNGSLVLGFNDEDLEHIRMLWANGRAAGIDDLEIVRGNAIRELEPAATEEAKYALHCPHTGVVDPYEVAIACAENAAQNGVPIKTHFPVREIQHTSDGFIIASDREEVRAKLLINAAGAHADEIAKMYGDNSFELSWRQGNLLVFDKKCGLGDIKAIYPVPTKTTKGVVVIGSVHGNTLVGSPE